MIAATYAVLLCAAACFAFRLLRGPTLSDRVIGIDGLLVVAMSAIATHAMHSGSGAFVPVIVTVTLVGFVSTSVVARFIEGRGA